MKLSDGLGALNGEFQNKPIYFKRLTCCYNFNCIYRCTCANIFDNS